MQDLAYDDIILFSKVVNLGSFSAAAKILHLSQSTISRRITTLEQKLGVLLLKRNTQRIELTEVGTLIYERSLARHQEFEQEIQAILKAKSILRGSLKVSLPLSFGEEFISPQIPNFIKAYPEINLTLIYQNRELDLLRDGFDIAIVNHIPRFPDQKIKLLYTAEIGVYCTPEYIKRNGKVETLEDLSGHSYFIGIDYSGRAIHNVEVINIKSGKSTIFEVPIRYTTNQAEQSKYMLYSHEIIAIGCTFAFKKDVQEGRLIRILTDYRMEPTKFYLTRHKDEENAKVAVFSSFVQNLFPE